MVEYEGIFYLELEDALDIYASIFEWSPAEAANHLRNRAGLESALDRPYNYVRFGYEADLALQAAVLVHGIAENQPFLDGNKRTAYAACGLFLGVNGYVLTASEREVTAWIEELATGLPRLSEEGLAERFRAVMVEG